MSQLHQQNRRPANRTIEQCEPRVYLSAQPVADLKLDDTLDQPVDPTFSMQTLAFASTYANMTGLNTVRSEYGFTGTGQTVVIIDTGIAYDHPDLGGGFGTSFRVVGGYDFAEGDANPYDDGPGGSHGTHVSGIVGGTSTGVAPGVDLVGLRVFNDQGSGYFEWVDQALQWVHSHVNSFEFPITTINLSLGTAWNSETIPSWANLESDFATLKADGIFISVAAGNSFGTYGTPGLSYPAVSPYVVPVASVDADGTISGFSQRDSRVIAAPGRSVLSTVPDYVGNLNGKPDDYASYSGTSMAAPFVAGSSVLIRQALQFVGTTNITEDMIYNIMRNTADLVYDPATNATYDRINVGRAVDSIMVDDYGSTVDDAYQLGTVSSKQLTGTIGRLDDRDYFSFTAAQTGTARFTVTSTGNLKAVSELVGGGATLSGNVLSFQVVAGQQYTLDVSTATGLGRYTADLKIDPNVTSLGAIDYKQLSGLNLANGEQWYSFTATRAGTVTVQALFAALQGTANLQLYNAAGQLIGSASNASGTERIDITASAGDTFFIRVSGTNTNVNLVLSDLVTRVGNTVNVAGTAGNDTFVFQGGSTLTVTVNGIQYQFASSAVRNVNFDGGAGNDTALLVGSAGNDQATLRPGSAQLSGSNYVASTTNVESNSIRGGGGTDQATFYDSAGDDTFTAQPAWASMAGTGFYSYVEGFGAVTAVASGGQDLAKMYDSAGDDTLEASPTTALLYNKTFRTVAMNFERVEVYASQGNDRATFTDSAGNDTFVADPSCAKIYGANYYISASGFDRVAAIASRGGADQAFLYDSAGNDTLIMNPTLAMLTGTGFSNTATGFGTVTVVASGGNDVAFLTDSSGDDTLEASPTNITFYGKSFRDVVTNFDRVSVTAAKGNDVASFTDSSGNDTFVANPKNATMYGTGYTIFVAGFKRVAAVSSQGGVDQAVLSDSTGNDTLTAYPTSVGLVGSGYNISAAGFAVVTAQATTGYDVAVMYDSAGDDTLSASPTVTTLAGASFRNVAMNFDRVDVHASQGSDRATFTDSPGNDTFVASVANAKMYGTGYAINTDGFRSVDAHSRGGNDVAYLYASNANDAFFLEGSAASVLGTDFLNSVDGFKLVQAIAASPQQTITKNATSYVFKLVGADGRAMNLTVPASKP